MQNNLRVKTGNPLTTAGSGFGDSAQAVQMRADSDPATSSQTVGTTATGVTGRQPGKAV